ncbi:MAG: DUF1848 family protein [Smithellaceae bacterium]
MIISCSRRTDIPAFYGEWFVQVRNPVNAGQVRRISLLPADVDCIVFWTKYPAPLLQKFSYYFLICKWKHAPRRLILPISE